MLSLDSDEDDIYGGIELQDEEDDEIRRPSGLGRRASLLSLSNGTQQRSNPMRYSPDANHEVRAPCSPKTRHLIKYRLI